MKRLVFLAGFFLAVATAALFYWQGGLPMREAEAEATSQPRQARDAAIPVVLAQARRMTLPVVFSTIGTIEPTASILVTAQVSGMVSEVAVADGAEVKQGDVLIALDARLIDTQIDEAQAAIAKDNANIGKAQRDLDRINKLLINKFETKPASGASGRS